MNLTELLNGVNAIQVAGNLRNEEIAGIEYDSRKVTKNSVFVAIKGFNIDGHKFIPDALNKGAIAIVLDNDSNTPAELFQHSEATKILVHDSRKSLAEISDYFFGHPSGKLNLIGITGTNGKTTTSYFIKNIVEACGYKTGLLGTISNYIGDKIIESKLTTPEASDLNAMLLQMFNEGCKYAVMEVSSHSLALERVRNLYYHSAIFTNITAEHLDFHHDFQSYLEAKKILFDNMNEDSFVIYNSDDKNSTVIIRDCRAKKYGYGKQTATDFTIKNLEYDLSGTSFAISYGKKKYEVKTSLIGEFNAYNACASFAVCKLNGFDDDKIISGIAGTPQIPGRFEVINEGDKSVIIDYSHTPDSLEKALTVVNKLNKKDFRVISVFGCGGNRDKLKRPEMGRIASEFSDETILTSDNPRDEDPYEIIENIKSGITKKNFKVIENREEAIKEAVEKSNDNTIILIAGKGHENYQEIKGKRSHFSDREVAEKFLHN